MKKIIFIGLLILNLNYFAFTNPLNQECTLSIQNLNNRRLEAMDSTICESVQCFLGNVTLTVDYNEQRINSFTFNAIDPSTSPLSKLIVNTPDSQNLTEVNMEFLVETDQESYNFIEFCQTTKVKGKTFWYIELQIVLPPSKKGQAFSFYLQINYNDQLNFSFLIIVILVLLS